METDPKENASGGHKEEEDHPGNVQGPGSVTVDEPTDPALSGTSESDFAEGEEDVDGDDDS